MEIGIYHDRCWISGDDTDHDRGHRESLLVGCIDGDCRGQLGISLQRGIHGVVTGGGSTAVDLAVDKTATNYGGEVPAARRAYMILALYIVVFLHCHGTLVVFYLPV